MGQPMSGGGMAGRVARRPPANRRARITAKGRPRAPRTMRVTLATIAAVLAACAAANAGAGRGAPLDMFDNLSAIGQTPRAVNAARDGRRPPSMTLPPGVDNGMQPRTTGGGAPDTGSVIGRLAKAINRTVDMAVRKQQLASERGSSRSRPKSRDVLEPRSALDSMPSAGVPHAQGCGCAQCQTGDSQLTVQPLAAAVTGCKTVVVGLAKQDEPQPEQVPDSAPPMSGPQCAQLPKMEPQPPAPERPACTAPAQNNDTPAVRPKGPEFPFGLRRTQGKPVLAPVAPDDIGAAPVPRPMSKCVRRPQCGWTGRAGQGMPAGLALPEYPQGLRPSIRMDEEGGTVRRVVHTHHHHHHYDEPQAGPEPVAGPDDAKEGDVAPRKPVKLHFTFKKVVNINTGRRCRRRDRRRRSLGERAERIRSKPAGDELRDPPVRFGMPDQAQNRMDNAKSAISNQVQDSRTEVQSKAAAASQVSDPAAVPSNLGTVDPATMQREQLENAVSQQVAEKLGEPVGVPAPTAGQQAADASDRMYDQLEDPRLAKTADALTEQSQNPAWNAVLQRQAAAQTAIASNVANRRADVAPNANSVLAGQRQDARALSEQRKVEAAVEASTAPTRDVISHHPAVGKCRMRVPAATADAYRADAQPSFGQMGSVQKPAATNSEDRNAPVPQVAPAPAAANASVPLAVQQQPGDEWKSDAITAKVAASIKGMKALDDDRD